jgi:hypothetical protein
MVTWVMGPYRIPVAATPAIAAAERAGISVVLYEYELDPRDLVRLTNARIHEIASRA